MESKKRKVDDDPDWEPKPQRRDRKKAKVEDKAVTEVATDNEPASRETSADNEAVREVEGSDDGNDKGDAGTQGASTSSEPSAADVTNGTDAANGTAAMTADAADDAADANTDAAAQAPRPPIDHPTAQGRLDDDGKFHCACGAGPIRNQYHNIASHVSKKHRADSADAAKRATDPRVCGLCGAASKNFWSFDSHIRKLHRFRGSSATAWADWQTSSRGDEIAVPERAPAQ
ncbi:hypothetical protein GGR52DRAFT_574155 [Hypoxylon sp. FL1284]|nr:hypothetical protein GGR52DRAFT_574155 [Hypoxylon sp. FL1284]